MRRRARVAGATGSFTQKEWTDLIAAFGGRCGYCGEERVLQPDHRVPLFCGGANTIENIIPACGPCNQSKGTLTEEEFRLRLKVMNGLIP